MDGLARNRNLRLVLALIVIAAGIAIAATTGDSWAVRWVTLLLSADVATRLAMAPRA